MAEHPFAQYVRILGKGKNGQRPLTRGEAYDAMSMIFRYDVEPDQLGAFLMLMRVKEETAGEVAGFVQAIRESIPQPVGLPGVSIDWPSYAGKRRQLPWYLLAALLLSRNGYSVFMHGLSRDDERIYTRQALTALGGDVSQSIQAAAEAIQQNHFAFLDIGSLSPLTAELLDTRDRLGLRSPLHTVVRMLNPFSAGLSLHSVFHPNYAQIHQQASLLLGDGMALSFKGEGGENERIPDRSATVYGMRDGRSWEMHWDAMLPPGRYGREPFPDLEHFVAVWHGDAHDRYADAAVTGTLSLCLQALEREYSQEDAVRHAREIWQARCDGHAVKEQCA